MARLELRPRLSKDGRLESTANGWRLGIPAGQARSYRLAQVDDQLGRRRKDYLWQPPLHLQLRARVSADKMPGTWGFGCWNDPYGFLFGPGELLPRLPALPQAAWFFCASERCYLSFRDDKPGNGFYAQVFSSESAWSKVTRAALTFPFDRRASRKLMSEVVSEDGAPVRGRPSEWHAYDVEWAAFGCAFRVDNEMVLRTTISPRGPLGLVLWIDNQYAAFDPQGRVRWGVEANPLDQWLEVEDLRVEPPR